MRWIFFFLVFMNIVFFAWGMVSDSPSPATSNGNNTRFPYKNFPELSLVSEMDPSRFQPAQGDNGSPRPESKERGQVAERAFCELVGPFESNEIAENFLSRLSAIEVKGEIKDIELPAGPGYWVYLESEGSRKKALRRLSELQSRKIDSYVIPKGDLENGISLGMFSKKDLAIARKIAMEGAGLKPKLEEIERSYRETWVMISKAEGEKMSDLSWERAMEGINLLERRQNYCLDVASQENFQ